MSIVRSISRITGAGALGTALLLSSLLAAPALAQSEDAEVAPETVGQYARSYRVYRRDIDIMRDMPFTSATEVRNAYGLMMEYEPSELTRGWLAHQALVASRAPGFMETVRTEARDRGQQHFFTIAAQNPGYLWDLSSTTAAINFVFDGLYEDAREARAVGRVLNDRAYAYMDTRYGSRLPGGAVENAAEILGSEPEHAGDRAYVVPYRAQHVMQRVLELAARLSLDRSGGQSLNAAGLLTEDRETSQCLRWARLNLAQCIAASRTTAEEAYCTGRHGIDDVSNCWGWIVNMDGEIEQAALSE